ncbi:hypothetical protein [Burkholderia multivorans]|uniref:hypothetical protein n=1 Tax=Burkholderia multivorans TaxID=87883 RepID=UPI0020B1D42C|nr:hypothetical protein [Burkholderia multivorans]
MIDTEKMKALAAKLRRYAGSAFVVEAADAIDSLLSELEAAKLERDKMMKALAECRDKVHVEGYGKSFLYEAIACPDDVPAFIGQTVTELRAALEAREADRRRLGLELEGVIIDTEQGYGFDEVCLATVKRVRAALAQRQEWGRR